MNVVELDVNNLNRWLTGALPGSGAAVDWTSQNGYLIYFSDRRGMLTYPGGRKVGEYELMPDLIEYKLAHPAS